MSESKMSLGTIYNFNKQLMAQTEPLDEMQYESGLNQVKDFTKEIDNKYFMLLCKELSDYTIFVFFNNTDFDRRIFKKDLNECLMNRGEVLSIERTEDGLAIEIWIKVEEEAFVYYLFPYDIGVIEVGKI